MDKEFIENPVEAYEKLKQECEELKEKVKKYGEINEQETKDYAKLKAENEELKKANIHIDNNRMVKADKLKRIEDLIIASNSRYFIQELLVILHEPEPVSFENKYLQTLAEIKEIALSVTGYFPDGEIFARPEIEQILQKISECEVENEN